MTARNFAVKGRVQGVGFRFWTLRMAEQRGITGWVRNRADGSVEVHAEGSPDALADLDRLLRQGPPASAVTHVIDSTAPAEGHTAFRVERTV